MASGKGKAPKSGGAPPGKGTAGTDTTGKGGQKGYGAPGGWPSTTGNKSGGKRGNAPPRNPEATH